MPTISILLPTYKPNEQYLREAVQSLLNQTWQDWELIICDEPTEVTTKDILSPYLVEEPRIQFFKNQTKLGIGSNWNNCLKKAKGTYIQYLFQDDLWEPEYLKTAITRLEADESLGFVCTMHNYKFEDSFEQKHYYDEIQKIRLTYAGTKHTGTDFLQTWLKRGLHPNIIGEPPFVCMRRAIMEQVGQFNEQLPQFIDSEYWIRLLQRTNFYFEAKSLGTFRVHEAGASAVHQQTSKGLTDRLYMLTALTKSNQKSIQRCAKQALKKQLPRMIAKYFTRKKSKQPTKIIQENNLKKFALLHPWLTGTSFLKAMWNYKKYTQENHLLRS